MSMVKGQGNKVMSSVWCMFPHNSTEKSRGNTEIGRKVVRATADIPHQVQGQGHQAALCGCSSYHLQGRRHIVATARQVAHLVIESYITSWKVGHHDRIVHAYSAIAVRSCDHCLLTVFCYRGNRIKIDQNSSRSCSHHTACGLFATNAYTVWNTKSTIQYNAIQ